MIRVFIVDDEYYIREGMKQIVPWEQLGCEISGDAESAEEAMEILNTQPADILIVDIHMYSMNGLELCDVIKKDADLKLSFSKMTFPHQLFRVMLLEQIYRSFKINEGSTYHK